MGQKTKARPIKNLFLVGKNYRLDLQIRFGGQAGSPLKIYVVGKSRMENAAKGKEREGV